MTLAILDTTRLLLRQLKETDVSAIYSLRSNEHVNQFIDALLQRIRKKQKPLYKRSQKINRITGALL